MLIVTWHPTFAMFRNPYEHGAFSLDLERFARATRGELREPGIQSSDRPSLEDIRTLVRSASFVAYDIETLPENWSKPWTGKDPTRAKLRMIGLGTEKAAIGYFYDDNRPSVWAEIKRVLESRRVHKVALNERWFDDRVLARYGVRPQNVTGLREMRRALSSTSKLSLAHITSLYTDAHPWKEDEEDDDKGLVFTDDRKKLALYNAYDVVYTSRAFVGMQKEAEWETPRVQRIYDVHRELARIAGEMHEAGIYVRETTRQFLSFCLQQERDEKRRKLRDYIREVSGRKLSKEWKPHPDNMRRLLFRRYKTSALYNFDLPDPQDPKAWSETGEIKVDKTALINLIIDPLTPEPVRRIIELFWEAEQPAKWNSTFVAGKTVLQAIGKDGRLRPGWNSARTDTMRWGCVEPNVMNLPQALRAMYGPAPGKVLVHADKSQLELRVMAVVSGDQVLARNLASGDVYSEDARMWFGLPADADIKKLYPKQRKGSKIIHLGKQYGAGKKTVFAQALRQDRGMKWSAVDALCDKFDETYSGTVDYWHREMKRVQSTGYSEGRVLGVRRTYPTEPDLSEVANYPIQTTAGEMMNIELIALDRELKKRVPSARILIQLHDAVDIECYRRDAATVTRIYEDVMGSREYEIEGRKATFPVEIKIAEEDWSEV